MFHIVLRVLALCLVEYISFELMRPAELNLADIKSFFILWAIINFFLLFRSAVDFTPFASLGMLGSKNPQMRMGSEAAQRIDSTYKYKLQKFGNLKFSNKQLAYVFCFLLNLLLYIIFRILF